MKWLLIVIVTNSASLQGGYSVAMEKLSTREECQAVADATAELARQGYGGKARTRCVEIGQ